MNLTNTLSPTAKDYLRDLRRHLTEYNVDPAISAALLADAREGLTGLDDVAAAGEIGRLGWAEDVARSVAREQAVDAEPRKGLSVAEWLCLALGLLAIVTAFVPFLGLGLAVAALVWAIVGRRSAQGTYRAPFWTAIAAVIVNVVVLLILLAGLLLFTPIRGEIEYEDSVLAPTEITSSEVTNSEASRVEFVVL